MSHALLLLALSSLLGVGVLAIVAQTTDPPLVAIPALPLHAGTTVRIDGRLIDVRSYDGGFARGLVTQGNRSVPLLSRSGFDASPGDEVIAEVRVLQENGRIELELERPKDLQVVVPWRDGHVQLERILADPWTYRESNLRTSGHLERDSRGLWLAADAEARLMIVAPHEPAPDHHVVVDGLFTYEPRYAAFRLIADRIAPAE